MTATVQELDTIAAVVSTLRTAPSAIRRRLCHGISVLLASPDGRYLEQVDVHLSKLEQYADDLRKVTGPPQST